MGMRNDGMKGEELVVQVVNISTFILALFRLLLVREPGFVALATIPNLRLD
jgi:hypothetical protein